MKLLRRTAASAQRSQGGGVADENALWLAHERALAGARDAAEAAQRIATQSAKQRAAFEAAAEQARTAAARAPELERTLSRLRDVCERLALVALNAGLEAARLGESVGRSLSLVSDEVRTLSERGGEAARELGGGISEVGRDAGGLVARFEEARAGANEIGQDAAVAASKAQEAERVLTEMGERLRRTTGSDPETLRAIAQATDHARALVTSLGALSGKVPRALLVGALRPVLEPLLRVVVDEDEGEEATE